MKDTHLIPEFFSSLEPLHQLILVESFTGLYEEDLENLSIFFSLPIEDLHELKNKIASFMQELRLKWQNEASNH